MLLTIEHRTRYRYEVPQRRFIESLRLTPSVCASQQTLHWSIAAEGAQMGASFTDGAGDVVSTLTCCEPFTDIELVVKGQVETHDTSGVLRDHAEVISPLVYLRHTTLTALDDGLRALAKDAARDHEDGSLEQAHALCKAVRDAITYQPGATHHDITAAEALANGAGVCQDHTHALIAIARAKGYPARYVVGYLHSDSEGKSHGASHAWAELYIDALGWVGFDATNGVSPDERYLRLGSGLNAHLAAPIRGVSYGGSGEEKMDISVLVDNSQQ